MGCESPELLGPGPAAEPLGPRLEGLGIDPDVRNGRFPRCSGQRDGACVPSRELRPGESGAGDCESRVVGDRMLSHQPADTDLDEGRLDDINRTVLARVFWDGRAFISSTLLNGTFALRLCIVNHTTTWDDVRETLEVVERFGKEALAGVV